MFTPPRQVALALLWLSVGAFATSFLVAAVLLEISGIMPAVALFLLICTLPFAFSRPVVVLLMHVRQIRLEWTLKKVYKVLVRIRSDAPRLSPESSITKCVVIGGRGSHVTLHHYPEGTAGPVREYTFTAPTDVTKCFDPAHQAIRPEDHAWLHTAVDLEECRLLRRHLRTSPLHVVSA